MANNGWFWCPDCKSEEIKVLVPDHVKVLEKKCPKCGKPLRKK